MLPIMLPSAPLSSDTPAFRPQLAPKEELRIKVSTESMMECGVCTLVVEGKLIAEEGESQEKANRTDLATSSSVDTAEE